MRRPIKPHASKPVPNTWFGTGIKQAVVKGFAQALFAGSF